MIRVHHRVGRRTWVSTPLWLAVIGYVLAAFAMLAVVALVVAVIVAAGLLYLLATAARKATASVQGRR